MNWELILTLTGLMLFAYWFTYITGSPLADNLDNVDVRAILFTFPLMLADRRVRQAGTFDQIKEKHKEELQLATGLVAEVELVRDWKRYRLDVGRRLFTWEKSFLCPICLHFWLTILVGLVFILFDIMHARADVFLAALVYLANHYIIRKIA